MATDSHNGRSATTVRKVNLDGAIRWTPVRRMSGGRVIGLLAVVLLTLSACSSTDSDEIVDLTTAPTEGTVAETTVVATAPSTTELRIASTTTEAPPTTAAQTTTSTLAVGNSSAEELEAEIGAAAIEARGAFLAYYYDPTDENRIRLADSRTVSRFERSAAVVDEAYSRGEALRPAGPDGESLNVLSVEMAGEAAAVVLACEVTDSVLYDSESGAVVDDDVYATLFALTMAASNDRWVLDRQVALASHTGARTCDS